MRRVRWSHRNHPKAIAERQAVLRQLPTWQLQDERILEWSLPPEHLERFMESLTGQMMLPVAVVGPLDVEFGRYGRDESFNLTEISRNREQLYVPIAHTEGGLSVSMQRGMNVLAASGGVKTYLLDDRMTRDSAFVFTKAGDAVTCSRWVQAHCDELRRWINDPEHPAKIKKPGQNIAEVSRYAILLTIETRVVGSVCHVLYQFDTSDACGPNMITRNAYALNREIVAKMESDLDVVPIHIFLEANLGGDKKPSHEYFNGGHGRTVLAEATISREVLQHQLNMTPDALRDLEWVGIHGSIASGMQSFGFTPASAIAAMFVVTGQDLGMVGTSSMAHGTVQVVPEGVSFSLQLGGLEVGTVGGGSQLPHAQSYLRLLGCLEPGGAQKLAQIIAGAALALEISASASMASRGSENFFRAHFERGGLRS
ncbi:MAG: 3-hydroxy-3-methylglutaryl-CoA reductase [Sulfobacillus benefaciens]|uniref:3-hydroxy-3-methylglutaryl-CoA reductase n=1 Tax=Sulfobacillus benefaciens TaxID=453960 RepID=A0A2T2XGH9_9FIRM|nr:MAG: 3-hydroxy-3-methylglutaryl-CoA reductase [Sulfobacillus benefaciens]